MKDQYGRDITYMRISVTDRCNLRCIYCMPEEGVRQVGHGDILTYDEIVRIARGAASLGITRVRLTGGEPLVRRGVDRLVRMLRETEGIREVALTTNGVLLGEQMKGLADAGVSAVNVSLDTLDRAMYADITRRDLLPAALGGLKEALRYPRVKVKVNCVPLRGINEGQWAVLAALAKEYPLDVRFIEMMPVGLGRQFQVCTQEEVLQKLRSVYGSEQSEEKDAAHRREEGPGNYVSFYGFRGRIGFISALSHPFCGACNRIRLTAEGVLKPCLQYAGGTDLRALVRGGADEDALREGIRQAVFGKPCGHHFGRDAEETDEDREMFRIGG